MKRMNLPKLSGKTIDYMRLFRGVNDSGLKLHQLVSTSASVHGLFSERATDLTNRIKEGCEALIINNPFDLSRKAEELVWIRVYHEFVQFYKRNKKTTSSDEKSLLRAHFVSGIGYLNNILLKISIDYNISISDIVPESLLGETAAISDGDTTLRNKDEIDWAKKAIHRLLIYMGDLARYLDELGHFNSKNLAISYYDAAIIWRPKVGTPYNQLATLLGGSNYNFDASYYYMRCLYSECPFEGAGSNLMRAFQANREAVRELKNLQTNAIECCEAVKRCILHFIHMANVFWFECKTTSESNISNVVQNCLSSLKHAITFPPKITTPMKPTYLCSSLVFEMGVTALMLIGQLQKKGMNNGPVHSAAVAFALNFFLIIVSECRRSLEEKTNNVSSKSFQPNTKANGSTFNGSQCTSKENTPELSPRRALSRLRRRKAAINFDDEDCHLLDLNDDDSELSELEETALSTIDALEISSDISENGSIAGESDFNQVTSSDDDSQSASLKQKNVEIVAPNDLLKCMYYETMLPTVKIFCDWLITNHQLFTFCIESFSGLLEQFVQLLNILLDIESNTLAMRSDLMIFKFTGPNWRQVYPLTTDFALLKFHLLEPYHEKSIELNTAQNSLDGEEMGFLCMECIVAFGHFIALNMTQSGINFNNKTGRFSLVPLKNGRFASEVDYNGFPSAQSKSNDFISQNGQGSSDFRYAADIITEGIENIKISSDINANTDPTVQKQVMRSMAHLWLKSEVDQLEREVRQENKIHKLPPYLVIDSSAYCDHLNLVKQLFASKRFIFYVPQIVLSDLDVLKKTSANSREASRWLEGEANKRSRCLKFQYPQERLSLTYQGVPIKYPKKKDNALDFYNLLEYCNYLNKQIVSPKSDSVNMVALLISTNNRFPANAGAVAASSDIDMENIELFVSKWRSSTKAKT